jgi:hypothetical protein
MLTKPGSAFKEPPRATRHVTPMATIALMFNLMVPTGYSAASPTATLFGMAHQALFLSVA